MMKKVYFAISFSDKHKFAVEIEYLVEKAQAIGIEIYVFVDRHHFEPHQEKEMMQKAFEVIDSSDFLIAELSKKSIGVGIEVGYAYAHEKPIIYLRKKGSDYSTTTAGCARYIVEYQDKEDMVAQILRILAN